MNIRAQIGTYSAAQEMEGTSYSMSRIYEPSVDVEILEDRELIGALNAEGFDCDKCGRNEPLVAVARFLDESGTIGICGDCYRELKGMSLGEVA